MMMKEWRTIDFSDSSDDELKVDKDNDDEEVDEENNGQLNKENFDDTDRPIAIHNVEEGRRFTVRCFLWNDGKNRSYYKWTRYSISVNQVVLIGLDIF